MSESRTLVCAVLLAAVVAAAVAAGTARMTAEDGPSVASVRIAELAAEHAEAAARADASPEDTAAGVRVWAAALDGVLAEIAERHRLVLLPARAVVAGAPDLTDAVRLMVEDRLKRAAAPARVSPARVSPAQVSGRETGP